jgi:DMSO/TMAO reductase YedYZ molybdopterin-dependent catalytic subunit
MKPRAPFFQQRRERRGVLRAGLAAAAGSVLAGCDAISHNETAESVLRSAESLSMSVQRVLGRRAMAQEFAPADVAPVFRANGTTMPMGEAYAAMVANRFSDWTLKVDGLVQKPLVFHCLDQMEADDEDSMYYESVDLDDAFHEQTILAYELNGKPLPVENGAPLRARIERQLGYKQPKYLYRIEAVAEFSRIAGGKGGYWEDNGYNWWGGI